jgi:hypothetical protein
MAGPGYRREAVRAKDSTFRGVGRLVDRIAAAISLGSALPGATIKYR